MLSVFRNINRFAGKNKLADLTAIFFARYLIYLMLVFLLAVDFFTNNIRLFFYCFLSGLFALFVIAKVIYFFYKEHRPAELRSTKVLIPIPTNPSFPSSHASFLFGLSFFILFYNFNLGILFLILSSMVGLARVFCGVHWFRDIIGGFLAGLISAGMIYYLLNFIK